MLFRENYIVYCNDHAGLLEELRFLNLDFFIDTSKVNLKVVLHATNGKIMTRRDENYSNLDVLLKK